MTQYITNVRLSDGFGSQYQHIICCILIAYRYNNIYVHNPISIMEHNYDNDPKFLEKMENLMNVRPYFINKNDENIKDIPLIDYSMNAKYIVDGDVNGFATDESLAKIKEMFWANKDRNVFTNGKTNVAVHVRRPNSHDNRSKGCDTPDGFYLKAIERIREEHANKDLQFHIYSQGNIEQFECFLAEDTELHINEDLSKTFIEMVAADMLVTSFSSLSYIAGYLSDGIIYYHNFWHPPRHMWIQL
jgi:hypothetical protein